MDTLTRIRAFIDVVEAEGFSAAARRTGRSKALLSKYVRELEDELGKSAEPPFKSVGCGPFYHVEQIAVYCSNIFCREMRKNRLIMTANIPISWSAQSRTCPWVSAEPSNW